MKRRNKKTAKRKLREREDLVREKKAQHALWEEVLSGLVWSG